MNIELFTSSMILCMIISIFIGFSIVMEGLDDINPVAVIKGWVIIIIVLGALIPTTIVNNIKVNKAEPTYTETTIVTYNFDENSYLLKDADGTIHTEHCSKVKISDKYSEPTYVVTTRTYHGLYAKSEEVYLPTGTELTLYK